MNAITAALRYSRALYDVACDGGLLPVVRDDVRSVDHILNEIAEIGEFCQGRHAHSTCVEFVEIAFCPYVHELTARTLRIATENGRLEMILFLPSAYERIRAEKEGVEQVVLETTQPADADLMHTVGDRMRHRLKRDVKLENRLNPDLIGGFRILWQDRVLDDSALARLHALRRLMGTTT